MQRSLPQVCYIFTNENGTPIKKNGMFFVFKSKWRAHAANIKTNYVIKKLEIDL